MRKLKITESQYKKLEARLLEAKNPAFDRQLKQKKAAAKQQNIEKKQQANTEKQRTNLTLKPVDTRSDSEKTKSMADKVKEYNTAFSQLQPDDHMVIQVETGKYKMIMGEKNGDVLDFQLWAIDDKELGDFIPVSNQPFKLEGDSITFGLINKSTNK